MKISTLTPGQARGEGQMGYRSADGLREQRQIDYALLKGRHYLQRVGTQRGSSDRQPVNPMQELIRTLTPFVAMNAPLSDVTPKRADLEFEASVRKQIYDNQAEELKLDELYQDAATEAFTSGVAFTLNGIKSGGEVFTAGNRRLDMGQDFCRLIDLDDVALDPNAKTLDAMRFMAHRYTVSRTDAIEAIADGVYGATPEDYEDGILPNPYIATPEEAEQILAVCTQIEDFPRRGQRVDENDGEWSPGQERMDDTIVLWDMVLYMHGETWIVTLPADPGTQDVFPMPAGIDKFLACYKWRGPKSGPINRLTFLRVPFNKWPLALAQMQRDCAEARDLLANKVFRQIMATRSVLVYDGTAENMAMAIKRSPDGNMVRGNPNTIKDMQLGGMVPDIMPGSQFFSDQWQNATGNLAMAAGSGDIGKTATAFEGLMGRIQSWLDFLRTRVESLATDDLRVRSWYLSNNPMMQRNVQQTIGQAPAAITMNIAVANPGNPQPMQEGEGYTMQGTHDDFDIKVRSFSMNYQNPIISAKSYMEAITNIVPIIIQLSAAGALNGKTAMSILARKLNEPELENLLPDPMLQAIQQQEQQMVEQAMNDPSGQNADTTPDNGPAGRKVPGNKRAMNPGPGMGSPRPMSQPMRPPTMAGAGV